MDYIKIEDLKYRYPNTTALALDGITLQIQKGEFIGVIGENGAGKSTFCYALLGLVPNFYKGAYGGSVVIDGRNVKEESMENICRKVGLVFQNPFNQITGIKDTVYEEIGFGLENLGIEKTEMERRIQKSMELLDIVKYKDRAPYDLSGGQMQRMALASIVAMQPEIIVLDEPTSQLDPQGSEEVFKAIKNLSLEGITIIMVEHKMEKIAAYCDQVVLLHQGRCIDYNTPQQVFRREDLDSMGIKPPVYTQVARALDLHNHGILPVTLWEMKQLVEENVTNGITNILHPNTKKQEYCQQQVNQLSINQLTFAYEEARILNNITLTLDQRPTAIIGQNGAGKTTFVKLLKGLLRPSSGTIHFNQTNLNEKTVAQLASQIGLVFQNPNDQIFKNSVGDEVMFGPLQIGMTKQEARKHAIRALQMVGLETYMDHNPYDLSLSERKLISIASILAMDTKVVIFDEPTIAQDECGKERIRQIILQLQREGKIVLSILHDMDFVAENFQRIIVFSQGEVVLDGTPQEVFQEKEILHSVYLEQPHVTQLANALGISEIYLSVDSMVKHLLEPLYIRDAYINSSNLI